MVDYVLISEPENYNDFYPFSALHCIWEIRCGILRLFEKIEEEFQNSIIIYTGREKHLDSFFKRENKTNNKFANGNALIFNASLVINEKILFEFDKIINSNKNKSIKFVLENNALAYYLTSDDFNKYQKFNFQFFPKELEFDFDVYESKNLNNLDYLWDSIFLNGDAIRNDCKYYFPNAKTQNNTINGKNGVVLLNSDDIYIADNVTIKANVVLDASNGPIIIDSKVEIMPFSTIIGPCYIGKNCIIKVGAKIYQDCSFGQFCKIGGEVENTIIHSFSNKQHDGFLGHSYLCEWVNLGAGTNNSDLKNTYTNISMKIFKREIVTTKMFLGLLCGDHTKSAINSQFNTGTITGICGVLVHEGFFPTFIPSFSWTGRKDAPIYKPSKALDVAKTVMLRRGKELTSEEEVLILDEYLSTIENQK